MDNPTTSTPAAVKRGDLDDAEYLTFLERVAARFAHNSEGPLFSTDAAGLWEAYLDAFPPARRSQYTCGACRRFIERYGGLVSLDAGGVVAPAFWDARDGDELHRPGLEAMIAIILRAKVTGVFLSSKALWGRPETGVWRHFAVKNERALKRLTQTARQAMAEKRDDFENVTRALEEFTAPMLRQAVTLLKTDALYRSEKVLGQAEWLSGLHDALQKAKGPRRANALWRAVALAPAGFCHPRSSMIGTLLMDIAAGIDFAEASRKFAAKMHPLQYQRPQAAPSAGNIAQAEKVMEQLDAAGSLARRYAMLDEIQTVWKPEVQAVAERPAGIFGHLQPKSVSSVPEMKAPAQTITWEKFARTALADARSMELLAPEHGNYCAIVTAENPEAPPILQWDRAERRNPFSSYVYHGGSKAGAWGLRSVWVRVTAIAQNPSQWFDAKLSHHGGSATFILEGARDSRWEGAGNALFPEYLISELRSIRSTIEAYAKAAKISGYEQSSACGLCIHKSESCDVRLRVSLNNGTQAEYRIDRWD